MKSIGETLREAREQKKLSIRQISQEINISREYLEAMEEENFHVFPAETYILGFLRNYADYLDLDQDRTIELYRKYKIGEEPVPLDALLGKKKRVFRLPGAVVVIIVVAVILLGGGSLLLLQMMNKSPLLLEDLAEAPDKNINARGNENDSDQGDESPPLQTVQGSGDPVAKPREIPESPVVRESSQVILENQTVPAAFTLNAQFRGYCFFRYQADDDKVVEKFYQEGEIIRLEVSKTLTMGYSSGGDVNIKISGIDIASGKAGEVAVKSVQWVKDDEERYDLVLFTLP